MRWLDCSPVRSMSEFSIPTIAVNDGSALPALGFGTYGLRGSEATTSVGDALVSGYRLIDSAVNYRNEREVGLGVAEVQDAAESVIVTTKLPGRHHGYDATMRSFDESLGRLGRVDLYLIHWPMPRLGKYVDSWRAMVELRQQGRVRSIGVSNFTERQLREIIDATGVVPAVNQVELHPEFPQQNLRRVHREMGVVTESWTPLGEGRTFADPAVTLAASKYGKTPAQVVLRWHVQLGALPIPKSASPQRRRENADVFDFELAESEVDAITALGRADGRLWGGDPDTNEEL
jgi:diketogulonate reductase-like aldo/keto reductase